MADDRGRVVKNSVSIITFMNYRVVCSKDYIAADAEVNE